MHTLGATSILLLLPYLCTTASQESTEELEKRSPSLYYGYPILKRDSEGGKTLGDIASYRPSWQFGKRAPWTGAWANIVWRPGMTSPPQGDYLPTVRPCTH